MTHIYILREDSNCWNIWSTVRMPSRKVCRWVMDSNDSLCIDDIKWPISYGHKLSSPFRPESFRRNWKNSKCSSCSMTTMIVEHGWSEGRFVFGPVRRYSVRIFLSPFIAQVVEFTLNKEIYFQNLEHFLWGLYQGWKNTNTYRENTGVRSCSPEHERTRTRIFQKILNTNEHELGKFINYRTRTNTNTRVFSSLLSSLGPSNSKFYFLYIVY